MLELKAIREVYGNRIYWLIPFLPCAIPKVRDSMRTLCMKYDAIKSAPEAKIAPIKSRLCSGT